MVSDPKSHGRMLPLTRRSAIKLGVLTASVGFAGCSALAGQNTPTQVRLVDLFVINLDASPHTVHVLVQANGDPVYWNSMEAEAFDSEEERAGGGAFEGYPTEPGKYDVYARYDGLPPGEWGRFEFSSIANSYSGDAEIPCIGLYIRIGRLGDESNPPRLSISKSVTC